MENTLKEENLTKKTVKIALKMLLDCFVGLMVAFVSIFAIFPKFSLKINQALGLKRVQEYNYQMIYDRSGNIADLYNLIIFEEELEKTNKELICLNEILTRNDYDDFCKAMDEASIKKINNKKLIPYSANVNGYLVGRKVYCLYSLGSKNVQSFVYQQTKNSKYKEYSFAVYVDLVVGDENLTAEQKEIILSEFIDLQELDTEKAQLVSMKELVKNKIDGLNSLIKLESTSENNKLIFTYELMRFYGANASLYEILSKGANISEDDKKEYEEKQQINLNHYNEMKAKLG